MSQDKDLEFVRAQLRKAAEIKDPREMWKAVYDILNLLGLILTPKGKEYVSVALMEQG